MNSKHTMGDPFVRLSVHPSTQEAHVPTGKGEGDTTTKTCFWLMLTILYLQQPWHNVYGPSSTSQIFLGVQVKSDSETKG